MGFTEAVKTVFSKYATFSGRAMRSEYWYFVLFNFLAEVCILLVCMIAGALFGGLEGAAGGYAAGNIVLWIYYLAVLVPGLAVSVRRLHDTGRSGWNLLWCLLPIIGAIMLLVWFVTDSKEDNQYGPRPQE